MKPKINSVNLPRRLRIELWIALYLLADKFNVPNGYVDFLLAFAVLYIITALIELSRKQYIDIIEVLNEILKRENNIEP